MIARIDRRALAEEAYHEFLGLAERGVAPQVEDFISSHAGDMQEELRQILAEHRFVREALQVFCAEPEAGEQMGGYQLMREMGRGGMGVVWEAEQLSLGRRVAVKVLHGAACVSRASMERFRREARVGAMLRHPGIVAVHDTGESDGRVYIIEELVPGGATLAHRIAAVRERGGIHASYYREEAERIALVADALEAAHEADIVHRDVKPSNILLDANGRPKLADFGLARLRDDPGLSESGEFVGTAFYASPEQASGRSSDVDARSDIFSLGVSLYEVLTLQRPFDGENRIDVFRRIQHEEALDPRRIRPRIPRELAWVCLRALEKNPDHRYATAEEFAADLRRFVAGQPVQARRPSLLVRGLRWVRRHPAISTGTTISVLAALLLGATGLNLAAAKGRLEAANDTADALQELNGVVLSIFNPHVGGGGALSPDDFFLRVQRQVEAKLPGRLELQAHGYLMMANTLREMNRAPEAERLARRALQLRKALFAPGTEPIAFAAKQLAVILSDEGQSMAARTLWEEQCASFVAGLKTRNDARAVEFLRDYGAFLAESGSLEQAESALQQALELARETSGEDSLATGLVLEDLGVLYCDTKRPQEAVTPLNEALAILQRDPALNQANILQLRMNLGRTELMDMKSVSQARDDLAAVLPDLSRVFGPYHLNTITCRVNLGMAMYLAGAKEEGLEEARNAASLAVDHLNPGQPMRRLAQKNAALLCIAYGRYEEARSLLNHAIEDENRAVPATDLVYWIADSYSCQEDYASALACLERLPETMRDAAVAQKIEELRERVNQQEPASVTTAP